MTLRGAEIVAALREAAANPMDASDELFGAVYRTEGDWHRRVAPVLRAAADEIERLAGA